MARPAPDPELVVRAFELANVDRWSHRRIADELGVSIGTVNAWIKRTEEWIELQRVSSETERDAQLAYTEWLLMEGKRQYDQGDPLAEWQILATTAMKLMDRRAKVLGGVDQPARFIVQGPERRLEPAQAEAVERVRARIEARERQIIEGSTS